MWFVLVCYSTLCSPVNSEWFGTKPDKNNPDISSTIELWIEKLLQMLIKETETELFETELFEIIILA